MWKYVDLEGGRIIIFDLIIKIGVIYVFFFIDKLLYFFREFRGKFYGFYLFGRNSFMLVSIVD